ncbi:MAG: hypothetical protein Q9166_004779 [cf. Caloplaca sp. 2 TL-2023]
MTLTTAEGTLLSNIKIYLTQAKDVLSKEGIRSLSRLTALKDILRRIAQEEPESIDQLVEELDEILKPDRERRAKERQEKQETGKERKRALEATDLNAVNQCGAKKHKVGHSALETASPLYNAAADAKKVQKDNCDQVTNTPLEGSDSNLVSLSTMPASSKPPVASASPKTTVGGPPVTSDVVSQPPSQVSLPLVSSDNHARVAESTGLESLTNTTSPQQVTNVIDTIGTAREPRPEATVSSHSPYLTSSSYNTPSGDHSAQSSPTTKASTPDTSLSVDKHMTSSINTLGESLPSSALPPPSPHGIVMNSQSITDESPLFMDENPETAIFSEDKDMMAELKDHFKDVILPKHCKQIEDYRVDGHVEEILALCRKLNFDRVKNNLLEFASLRQQNPGSRLQISDLAENAEPMEIYNAIEVTSANESDARLQKIYGKIRLWKSIEKKIGMGYVPKWAAHLPNLPKVQLPGFYVDDMADDMSRGGSRDAKKRKRDQLHRAHQAGKQWIQLVKDLGGAGVVFVLIFAKISPSAFERGYNDFQRDCFTYILHQLPSIKNMIKEIGDNVLEDFCRQGQISLEVMDRIRACDGPQIAFVESEDEDSADDDDDGRDDGTMTTEINIQDHITGNEHDDIEVGHGDPENQTELEGNIAEHSEDSPMIIDENTADSSTYTSDDESVLD